jgi:hypothetical protein
LPDEVRVAEHGPYLRVLPARGGVVCVRGEVRGGTMWRENGEWAG